MELRLLQSFLVLSEELHFGRAASRLYIAQPPLTKQIRQLEKYLGVQLFERHPKGARLTPAGRLLSEQTRDLFERIDEMVHDVRNVEHGESGHLRIGASGKTGASLLPSLLRSITSTIPGVNIDVERLANSTRVAAGVVEGTLDLGLVMLPFEHAELNLKPITSHRPLLAVAADHPWADRGQVSVAELEEQRFILPRRNSGSALLRLGEEIFGIAGISPTVVKETEDSYQAHVLVDAGLGVTLTVTGVYPDHENMVFLSFEEKDLPTLDTAVAWRNRSASALIERAVEAIPVDR